MKIIDMWFGTEVTGTAVTGNSASPPNPVKALSKYEEVGLEVIKVAVSSLMFIILIRYLIRRMDPTYEKKEDAKAKAKQLMKRLGVKNVNLNGHEGIIANHLVDPKHLKISWTDIGGLDLIIEQLKGTVIYPILAKQKYINFSQFVQPPKGILLYGPPGCGKTLIAKAMAKEAKCLLINLDISSLNEKWYGESQKLVAAVFSLAKKIQPCIIFIDEIDSLLRSRTSQDHEVTAMMKAQFMSLWDGLMTDPKKTIIVMGATNRPKDVDRAILRRMSAKFYIPPPDRHQRKHILHLTLRKEKVASDVNLDKLAEITEGFSGSDLTEVVRAAAVAFLSDRQFINELLSTSSRDLPTKVLRPNATKKNNEKSSKAKSWLQRLNPFAPSFKRKTASGAAVAGSVPNAEMTSREISMKDFELSVKKVQESKAHCSAKIVLRTGMDLLD